MSDDQFEISNEPRVAATADKDGTTNKCKFSGVQFACSAVCSRVYMNHDSNAYQGHCPNCSRKVGLKIGRDDYRSALFHRVLM